MTEKSQFCTCTNLKCPFHPTNHDKGCTPCIKKNLNRREIPSCFFNKLENTGVRDHYKFEDFAELVLKSK